MNIKDLMSTVMPKNKKMGKRVIPFVLLLVISCVWISVSAASVNVINICVYGEEKQIVTSSSDLERILDQENIKVGKNDKVDFSPVKDGEGSINISKRYEVTVKFQDAVSRFLVEDSTVKEALEFSEIGFNPEKHVLNKELTSEIKEDTVIEVSVKPELKPEPKKEEPKKEESKKEESKKEESKKEESKKEEPKNKTPKKSKSTKKTSKKTSNSADKENFTIEIDGKEVSVKKMFVMNGTAYTYGEDGGNATATGVAPKKGVVAVDPKVIPLGSRLYIKTPSGNYIYGHAIAADTGGAIKGKKIDIFLESEKECYNFGRRNLEVYVLK